MSFDDDSHILTHIKYSPIYQAGVRAGHRQMQERILAEIRSKGYGNKLGTDAQMAVRALLRLLDAR